MSDRVVAAVDLGASSGRVMVGRVSRRLLDVVEVHRFPNEPVVLRGALHWDIERLSREVLIGLRAAARAAEPADDLVSIGVDAWGIDHGLLDEAGALLGNPVHYRDPRTLGVIAEVHATIPPAELYVRTGIAQLPFNTIYQLAAARRTAAFPRARTMLLIPDLIGWWLTGVAVAEVTNASTTALLDVKRRSWDAELIERLGLPRAILPQIRSPGDVVGPLRAGVRDETGIGPGTALTLVGSHDTASAVVGVPAAGDVPFAYIACGTWALVGVELDRPILTEPSRAAAFTNEAGVDGRTRYLRHVMGLWLLSESLRAWALQGSPENLPSLLAAAADVPAGGPAIDPDDSAFVAPGDVPSRIDEACERTGLRPPASRPALVRCILDSLAAAFARSVRDAGRLSGTEVEVVHLVGGGARNALLCQLTADACGLPVLAGPAEATSVGNVLVQARAHGLIAGDLESLRALIRSTQEIRRYEPRVPGSSPDRT